jgi:hypothetical protein
LRAWDSPANAVNRFFSLWVPLSLAMFDDSPFLAGCCGILFLPFGPPSLADVVLFFGFRQLSQFVGRITQDPEKDAAPVVLVVGLSQIGQTDHLFR